MLIRVGFDLNFEIPAPTPMLLMLYVHPSRYVHLTEPEFIRSEPSLTIDTFIDTYGNRVGRIDAPAGQLRLWNDAVVQDSGVPDPVHSDAAQWALRDLPPEALHFLMGSRYCETDRLSEVAWSLFGNTPLGWPRVQAVSDWVHNNVKFGYQYARPTKTAYDVYTERQGVCRDFTHLLITFLRCLNIPARYATGYLGDIGVPQDPSPMDFSAWTEVFLGGRWYSFDARHNMPRIGRIVMARGRDACDAALTTSFGPTKLLKFTVVTDEITDAATIPAAVVVPVT
ncbi:MAG: transglutaminase family protein [Tepidisphaeraceae bacterium]